MNNDCRTCCQSLGNKLVGARVSEEDFVDALSRIPLSISSTRRSGQNGLRNGDEVYRALQAAGYGIYKIREESKSWWDDLTAEQREEYNERRAEEITTLERAGSSRTACHGAVE